MKTAKEFAREAVEQVPYDDNEARAYNVVLSAVEKIFQSALKQPPPFVDDFVPIEEGWYKYGYPNHEKHTLVYVANCDGERFVVWFIFDIIPTPLSELPKGSRFSHRLTVEGGE